MGEGRVMKLWVRSLSMLLAICALEGCNHVGSRAEAGPGHGVTRVRAVDDLGWNGNPAARFATTVRSIGPRGFGSDSQRVPALGGAASAPPQHLDYGGGGLLAKLGK
jgi:hypothetical protein